MGYAWSDQTGLVGTPKRGVHMASKMICIMANQIGYASFPSHNDCLLLQRQLLGWCPRWYAPNKCGGARRAAGPAHGAVLYKGYCTYGIAQNRCVATIVQDKKLLRTRRALATQLRRGAKCHFFFGYVTKNITFLTCGLDCMAHSACYIIHMYFRPAHLPQVVL